MTDDADWGVLARLAATIEARRGADPASSYTARMLAKGAPKAAQKFGEEAVEAVIEAARGDRAALAGEAADTLYHLLVMLAASGVPPAAVLERLAAREGLSGHDEKAARATLPEIRPAASPEDIARCLALRTEVFIAEQGVSAAEEQDGADHACRHWIALLGPRTLATARLRPVTLADGRDATKIQRFAVARGARGTGLGRRLMQAILAAEPGPHVLDSQESAIPFYERLGFVAEGPVFLDAGIPHRHMRGPSA